MRPEASGAELVRDYLASGEPELFDELVRRYRERTFRAVLSVLGPELAADADDVVQETFLKAHDRLASFRGEGPFGSWLYRIAYRRAMDHRRVAARRERRERESASVPRPGAAAGALLLADERARAVRRALARLPPPYQAALRAHYWLEMPVAEIGQVLGVPEGTVKSYLHRGRARLARLLETRGGTP